MLCVGVIYLFIYILYQFLCHSQASKLKNRIAIPTYHRGRGVEIAQDKRMHNLKFDDLELDNTATTV